MQVSWCWNERKLVDRLAGIIKAYKCDVDEWYCNPVRDDCAFDEHSDLYVVNILTNPR